VVGVYREYVLTFCEGTMRNVSLVVGCIIVEGVAMVRLVIGYDLNAK